MVASLNFCSDIWFHYLFDFWEKIIRQKDFRLEGTRKNWDTGIYCQSNRNDTAKEFPFSDPNVKKHRDLIYLLLVNDGAILTQDNEVELFVDGHEKFDALIADIEKAKDHIHLIYYIFHSDELGNRLMRVLERKAAEGLNVKIIYDAMGSRTTKKSFFRTFQKNGGLVRPFFRLNYH